MFSGLTRLVSRIKLAWFVFRNPEWKCKPWCLKCEFFDTCLYEYEVENGESIEYLEEIDGDPVEPEIYDDIFFIGF